MFARTSVVAALAAVALSGCGRDAVDLPPSERSSAMTVASIPPTPVAGLLEGRRFTTRTAWYRVERKAGRERIDLIFSEGRPGRLCAESVPENARHVWARFPGLQRFTTGELRTDGPSESPFSMHHESTEQRVWTGRSGGSAVISVDTVNGTTVVGRLRACFGGPSQGCVQGSFQALECRNELDPDGPAAGNVRRTPEDAGPPPSDASR